MEMKGRALLLGRTLTMKRVKEKRKKKHSILSDQRHSE
jgi:hypothetical protein